MAPRIAGQAVGLLLALQGAAAAPNASQVLLRGSAAEAASSSGAACKSLDAPENEACRKTVRWSASGGKNDPNAEEWYRQMPEITGVTYQQASEQDFQRLYFCAPPGGTACGTAPCGCSTPPCDSCFGSSPAPAPVRRKGCDGPEGIRCRPPESAMDYNGEAWPTMTVSGPGPTHIFAIGDWGGLDGSMNPIEGRPPMVAYGGGARSGPSVFPRSRWDKRHSKCLCGHKELVKCYNTHGDCDPGCGWVAEIDSRPQFLVAEAMKARASKADPKYMLNVGDNFYWGGIEKTCGSPMNQMTFTAHHQFNQIFEGVYQGAGLSGKPWFSVLGNHDWGGRQFYNGWDQQIAYTWASPRWVLPAAYYSLRVEYPDQDFNVDYFFVDSNMMDAKEGDEDPEHNICGTRHNPPGVGCASAGGPASQAECKEWFWSLWAEQQQWLEQKVASSNANWQIVVTHFPCGHQPGFYSKLRGMGLDLLVTGHRHDQELWMPGSRIANEMGGLPCFVTGGGGGITSEATPNPEDKSEWYGEGQYGFYDLTISRDKIIIESVNWDGNVTATGVVRPSR